jgi:glycosyltransferase involved in cell wall biosynthesis
MTQLLSKLKTMKLGIIIICHNIENDIDIRSCIKYLNNLKDIEVCLVNNNSKDKTYTALKMIKEGCIHVSIVNIKKLKSDSSAVKAGARFMSNKFNISNLGFVNSSAVKEYESLSVLIRTIDDSQIDISIFKNELSNKKEIKRTLFQSLFSVMDFLTKINSKKDHKSLNRLGKY